MKEKAQIKFKIKNLDEFNKWGNCKVQEGVLIYIEKISIGKFNKGGNCKLQEGALTYIEKNSIDKFNKRGNCKLQFPQETF